MFGDRVEVMGGWVRMHVYVCDQARLGGRGYFLGGDVSPACPVAPSANSLLSALPWCLL